MFTWSEQRSTEILFIFCSSSVTEILSVMLLCSEFMGLGAHTHKCTCMRAVVFCQHSL